MIRLYHLAKTWSLPAGPMLEALRYAGRQLDSHFVAIGDEEVESVRAVLEKAGLFQPQAPSVSRSTPEVQAEVQADDRATRRGEDEHYDMSGSLGADLSDERSLDADLEEWRASWVGRYHRDDLFDHLEFLKDL